MPNRCQSLLVVLLQGLSPCRQKNSFELPLGLVYHRKNGCRGWQCVWIKTNEVWESLPIELMLQFKPTLPKSVCFVGFLGLESTWVVRASLATEMAMPLSQGQFLRVASRSIDPDNLTYRSSETRRESTFSHGIRIRLSRISLPFCASANGVGERFLSFVLFKICVFFLNFVYGSDIRQRPVSVTKGL